MSRGLDDWMKLKTFSHYTGSDLTYCPFKIKRGLDDWIKLNTFHITQVQTYYPFKMSRGLDDWMKLKNFSHYIGSELLPF